MNRPKIYKANLLSIGFTMKKKLFLFFVFFSATFLFSQNKIKSIRDALKNNDSLYFQNIKQAELKEQNIIDKDGKSIIAKIEIAGVPALVGAFKNSDPEVRKIIYTELLFIHMFNDLKDITPVELISQDKELKSYLDKLREAIYSVEESETTVAYEPYKILFIQYGYTLKEAIKQKNSKAISMMSPEYFKRSNNMDTKGVVNRFKQHGVKTLISAIESPTIHIDLKKQIVDLLAYPTLGGPEKIITKKKIRRARAESIFLTADRETDEDLKQRMILLAESYYFPETDEASSKDIQVETEEKKPAKKKKKGDES
jgi:hypothetical protein